MAEPQLDKAGWHSRGYLPHINVPGLIQMVTFRLADSMPVERRAEWAMLLTETDLPKRRKSLQAYMDAGHGSCMLADPEVAALLEAELLRGDGKAYRLIAWVIMPNHVHVLVEPLETTPISAILKQWKGASAFHINKLLGRSGSLWQRESFDRYIRSNEHLVRAIAYIEGNPVSAGIVKWTEDFRWSSAWRRRRAS